MDIVYCQMTQNRMTETKACVDRVLPYVDHVVLVDGGSIDDSIFYFRNWCMTEPKLHFFLHPWNDNFSEQRTNYLIRAREVVGSDDFWVLVSDPDELFEKEGLENLKAIAEFCEDRGANMAQFRSRSVTVKGEERVWENLDEYWKGLFFKYTDGIVYIGNPHETLVPREGLRPMQTSFIYEHLKQEGVIWHRGARNAYVGGGGPNLGVKNKLWVELLSLVREEFGRELSWHEFDKELIKGNLAVNIKDWLVRVSSEDGWDGSSEMREFYKLYFRVYHPEEESEEMKEVYIP